MKRLIMQRLRDTIGALALAIFLVAALAAGFVPMLSLPAQALTIDPNRNATVRQLQMEAVNYWRLTINYNDANIGAGVLFGGVGASAYILSIDCAVTVAFNAVTTNVITLGVTKASANEIVASGITAGTIGVYHLTTAAGLGTIVTANTANQLTTGGSAWVPLYAKYAQTGTAATAGSVTCVIAYVPNNDL